MGDAEALDLAAAQVDDVEALLGSTACEKSTIADTVARGDLVLVERRLGAWRTAADRCPPGAVGERWADGGSGVGVTAGRGDHATEEPASAAAVEIIAPAAP